MHTPNFNKFYQIDRLLCCKLCETGLFGGHLEKQPPSWIFGMLYCWIFSTYPKEYTHQISINSTKLTDCYVVNCVKQGCSAAILKNGRHLGFLDCFTAGSFLHIPKNAHTKFQLIPPNWRTIMLWIVWNRVVWRPSCKMTAILDFWIAPLLDLFYISQRMYTPNFN